jgi:hypothetical protein
VRVVGYILLAVNLVYLAWAGWVDTPEPAPQVKQSEPLPRLVLVSKALRSRRKWHGGGDAVGGANLGCAGGDCHRRP